MLKAKDIDRVYPNEVYSEQVELMNMDKEATDKRFKSWSVANKNALQQIYVNGVLEMDVDIITITFKEWVRQSFINFLGNERMAKQTEEEINELIGG